MSIRQHSKGELVSALKDKVATLAEIRAGSRQYKTGDPQEQAGLFYYDEVLPIVIAAFRDDSAAIRQRLGSVGLLISMLGFSPETAVLAYHALRPEHLLLLYSGNAVSSIDVVRRFVVGQGKDRLPASAIESQECPPTDPNGIGDIIEHAVAEMCRRNPNPIACIVVDITGGKKVMSAAAALAAARLGLAVVYIDGDYDPKLRRPQPGSERLILIDTVHQQNRTS